MKQSTEEKHSLRLMSEGSLCLGVSTETVFQSTEKPKTFIAYDREAVVPCPSTGMGLL